MINDSDYLCEEVLRLKKELANIRGDIENAKKQAVECCPDYPWGKDPDAPISEIAWALCSTIKGLKLAIEDYREDLEEARREPDER